MISLDFSKRYESQGWNAAAENPTVALKTELLDGRDCRTRNNARVTSYRRLNRARIKREMLGAAGVKSERVVRIIVATDVNRGKPPVGWATRESAVSVLSLADGRPVKKKKRREKEKAHLTPTGAVAPAISFFARPLSFRSSWSSRAVSSLATIKTPRGY